MSISISISVSILLVLFLWRTLINTSPFLYLGTMASTELGPDQPQHLIHLHQWQIQRGTLIPPWPIWDLVWNWRIDTGTEELRQGLSGTIFSGPWRSLLVKWNQHTHPHRLIKRWKHWSLKQSFSLHIQLCLNLLLQKISSSPNFAKTGLKCL